jgi:hypothetical protein
MFRASRIARDTDLCQHIDEDGLNFNYPLFNSMRDATRAQVRLFAMSDQRRI